MINVKSFSVAELMDSKVRKQRAVITLRDTTRKTFYVDPGGNGNQCKSGEEVSTMRLGSDEEDNTSAKRAGVLGNKDKTLPVDVDPLQGSRPYGAANNNITTVDGSRGINTTMGSNGQAFALSGRNVSVRSEIENRLLEEICQSRYTVDPLPGLFARHRRSSSGLKGIWCEKDPMTQPEVTYSQIPSSGMQYDDTATIQRPVHTVPSAERTCSERSSPEMPFVEVPDAEGPLSEVTSPEMPDSEVHMPSLEVTSPELSSMDISSDTKPCGDVPLSEDTTTSPLITKISQCYRRDSVGSEDLDAERTSQGQTGDSPRRKHGDRKRQAPAPPPLLESNPQLSDSGIKVATKEVRRHRRRRYKKHKSVNSDQEEETPKLKTKEYDGIKSTITGVNVVQRPTDGWSTDGHYSSCGEETLEEVMKKIKKYNRSMGTFHMEATSGESNAEFQGVLRFYHMDGPHAVSKALKLKSTTTVAQLRPLLVDKFSLSRHLEERNETIQSVRLFHRRFDGEVPLEDGDRPLELALTSRCRSRFVVRVPTLEEDGDLATRMMHTQENPSQDPDLPQEAILVDSGHARRSKHRHHRRKSKSHRGTDGTVSDSCADWENGGFTEGRGGAGCECGIKGRSSRRPHKCYESDGGMDIASDTGGRGDTRSSASSRRGRRRREKKDKEQLPSETPRRQRESSLERLSNQLSLRKGSLRLSRSMNNLVQKTLSLRQKDNPFRRTRPELSTEESAPGVLKIFGGSISPGAEYKSVLATPSSTGRELVKEALERYQISRRQGRHYVLCDVIGSFHYKDPIPYRVNKKGCADPKRPQPEPVWVEQCVRIVGDHERPLTIQAFWKPSADCSRRFELRKRADMVANVDTVTSGINANARRMLVTKSRLRPCALTSGDVWPEHLSHPNNADPNMSSSALGADNESYLSQSEDHADSTSELPVAHAPGVSGQGTAPASHPYLLTLRGYNEQLDELVHVLREQVTMVGGGSSGQRPPTSTPEDIWLPAPDLLPEHCWLSRSMTDSSVVGGGGEEQLSTALDPIPGAVVSVNGRQVDSTVTLRAGDVVELGQHYAFLYKTAPRTTDHGSTTTSPLDLTNVRHSMDARPGGGGGGGEGGGVGVSNNNTTNTSVDSGAPPDMLKWTRSRSDPFEVEPGRLRLGYVREKEDDLLDRIMTVTDRYPRCPKLATAYLTSMCVEHSLAKFGPSATRDLISKLSNLIQVTVWEATKLLADKQSSVTSERPTHISDLIPELQPLILWLSNAVELHYFFRKNVREALRKSGATDPKDGDDAPPEDEMVVVLEDVVKYTFQQTVYYLTKALYRHLPAVLERNPFNSADQDAFSSDPLCTGAPTVEGIIVILETTLTSLKELALHPEIVSQLFCYLFFFTSTNLFNMLMARDAGPKYYKWSKGAQVRGNLDTLEAWAASSGLAQEAVTYLSKINTLTNLLATPRLQLLTANWAGLRRDFPGLNSEQLLKVLTEYELGPGQDQPESWVPPDGAIDPITWSSRLTEGFTDHPPLRLPKGGFIVDLGNPSPEEDLCDVIQRVSAEFGASDDDGDSGLSVSQTLPVFTDIPQSPVYIAEATTDDPTTVSSPTLYISNNSSSSGVQGTSPQEEVKRELPPYPGPPSQVDCHPASSTAPCKSAPCPVPPKRRNKYDRSHKGPAPAPPRANPSSACSPASFPDTSGGTGSRSPQEVDLGDSGISMSASERGGSGRSGSLPCPGSSSSGTTTWTRADSSPEVADPRDRKSHCDASQATLPSSSNTSGNLRSNTSPKSTRRNRDNSKSPPRYWRNQKGSGSKADTAVTTTTTATGTGPLAMSSPVSSDSTSPCPSPVVDVLSGIPPQPQKPAPTLDRSSIRRSPRAGGSRREHSLQLGTGEGDDVNKVVEVNYLQPPTPDGVVNGLRVLPVGEATQSKEDSTLKSGLLQTIHSRGEQQESSSVDGDLVAGQQQEDEQEDVYIVDLVKGERGLGLGLIDGLFTPLRRPGIYVRTLVPGEPAERDGRLQIGDRILAVNGRSVVGADYRSAMNTIRDGGQFLQFLVAQGSRIITMQITASSC